MSIFAIVIIVVYLCHHFLSWQAEMEEDSEAAEDSPDDEPDDEEVCIGHYIEYRNILVKLRCL